MSLALIAVPRGVFAGCTCGSCADPNCVTERCKLPCSDYDCGGYGCSIVGCYCRCPGEGAVGCGDYDGQSGCGGKSTCGCGMVCRSSSPPCAGSAVSCATNNPPGCGAGGSCGCDPVCPDGTKACGGVGCNYNQGKGCGGAGCAPSGCSNKCRESALQCVGTGCGYSSGSGCGGGKCTTPDGGCVGRCKQAPTQCAGAINCNTGGQGGCAADCKGDGDTRCKTCASYTGKVCSKATCGGSPNRCDAACPSGPPKGRPADLCDACSNRASTKCPGTACSCSYVCIEVDGNARPCPACSSMKGCCHGCWSRFDCKHTGKGVGCIGEVCSEHCDKGGCPCQGGSGDVCDCNSDGACKGKSWENECQPCDVVTGVRCNADGTNGHVQCYNLHSPNYP